MKKILTLLVAIFTFAMLSFSQGALTVQGGYSWTMGMVGVEYQFSHFAIGSGIMPTTMPGSDISLTSYSAYLAWTSYNYDESGYYVSLGFASSGYREETSYNNGAWTDGLVVPMTIINSGYKLQAYNGLNLKAEVGYGWCEYAGVFTYGVTLGWTFEL